MLKECHLRCSFRCSGTRYAALLLAYIDSCIYQDPFHLVFILLFVIFLVFPFLSNKLWLLFVLYSEFVILALYWWDFSFMKPLRET